MKTRLIIVDASHLMYRNYYGKGTRELRTSKWIRSGMFYGFLKSILSLKERFQNPHILTIFDNGYSGREMSYPEYKRNKLRKETEKPKSFYAQGKNIRVFLRSVGMQVIKIDGIEADDIISIAARTWTARHKLNNVIIVSSDRDFFQIVDTRIMLADEKAGEYYGPDEVFAKTGVHVYNYLRYKCLLGDMASDNITGVPGIGKVKSAELALSAPACLSDEKHIEIFWRNYHLMELPKTFHEMRCMTKEDQHRHTQILENIFGRFELGSYTRKEELAQKYLDFYECQSLKLEDFY